jgi:hypothetical protein
MQCADVGWASDSTSRSQIHSYLLEDKVDNPMLYSPPVRDYELDLSPAQLCLVWIATTT